MGEQCDIEDQLGQRGGLVSHPSHGVDLRFTLTGSYGESHWLVHNHPHYLDSSFQRDCNYHIDLIACTALLKKIKKLNSSQEDN